MADQEDRQVAADADGPFIKGLNMLVAMIILLVGILAGICTTQVRPTRSVRRPLTRQAMASWHKVCQRT